MIHGRRDYIVRNEFNKYISFVMSNIAHADEEQLKQWEVSLHAALKLIEFRKEKLHEDSQRVSEE